MQSPPNELSPNGSNGNALKTFQLDGNTRSKLEKKYGEKIVLQVEGIINSNYFLERNARFAANRAMDTGRMDTKKFMDFFNINGKTNYMNINWKSIMIVNTIVSRLVGRWMTKKEKAIAKATDPVSIKAKKYGYDKAEFILDNKDRLVELEQASGVPAIGADDFVADDRDHLDLWAHEEQRLPEEILYEKGVNNVFDENGWGDMGGNTRKIKHDSAIVGFIGAETIADKHGKVLVNYCKPENSFYSYSEYDDFRDSDIKGEIVSYKLTQIRDMYPKLTMEELWEIAKVAKEWRYDSNITFNTGWHQNMFLPFDDWNVEVVRFTLKTLDVDKSLIKTARDGSMYVDKPKKKIDEVYQGNEYVEKTIWNIYRGVYVRQTKFILEWGLEKNMIKPQDYEKISEAQSPYSFYMYQNVGMRNLAVPEKIEEPVEQMILARLKIQQLVAKLRPSGYQYDIDGLSEMDLGNGVVKPLELQKVTDQTGNVYYRSRDAEGNRIENPIKELPNAGSVAQLQQLIEIYNYHLQVLRDEIGINEFAEGQTIKPRTGQENVQTALEVSFNATDYMNDACISLKDQIADKVACLLHDSVEFGSGEYRELMGEKDVKNRSFKMKFEMLPTIEDITKLENTVNQAIAAQPDLVLYINPEKIKRIAKDNVKLAETYFRQGQKRAIKGALDKSRQDSEMNAKLQQQSNEQAAQKAIQLQIDKLSFAKQIAELKGRNEKENTLLEKGLEIWKVLLTPKTGEGGVTLPTEKPQMPPALDELLNLTFKSVALSLTQETLKTEQEIINDEEEREALLEEKMMQQQQAEQQVF